MQSTQFTTNQKPMAVGIGNKLSKAIKQSSSQQFREMQKQKQSNANANPSSVYSTNTFAQRSSQIQMSMPEKVLKDKTPKDKSPVSSQQQKNKKSAYVSQAATAGGSKKTNKSPVNNQQATAQGSTRAGTQNVSESQIGSEDREKLISYSLQMSQIEQQHDSSSPINRSMVQAIEKQFSNDSNGQLDHIIKTAINQNMVRGSNQNSDQSQIGYSANQPPLEPEPAHFFTDLSHLAADDQDESGMDPSCYAMCLQNAEKLFATVQHLDWQLSCSKHALRKYKDLVIAQQLRINAQAVKLGQFKLESRKAREAQVEAETQLASQMNTFVINKEVQEQLKQQQKTTGISRRGDVTPEKLGTLLHEINTQLASNNQREVSQTNLQSDPIDMIAAKKVMKGMDSDQQNLVEELLNKLKQEQKMRLQSEEQHEQMLSQMVVTQKQLEQQIRMLKQSKGQGQDPSAPSSQSGIRIETEDDDVGSTINIQTSARNDTMHEMAKFEITRKRNNN